METVETKTLIMYLVTANIVGLIFSFASFIFEKEEWSILKQTMIHFIVLLGTFYLQPFGLDGFQIVSAQFSFV